MSTGSFISVMVLRHPERTALWLPLPMVRRMKLRRRQPLTAAQMAEPELAALLESRRAANASGKKCDGEWHRRNGYAN